MQTTRDDYFTACRSLKPARDAKGMFVVDFHGDDTRTRFIPPLKERIVREVAFGPKLQGASSGALLKSKQAKSEPAVRKIKSA
jgi:hypothetical protein